MDALATGEHFLATNEKIKGIANFLESVSNFSLAERVTTDRVLLVRHGIERTLLRRHLVYVKAPLVSTPSVESQYGVKRTQDVVISMVLLPDQPSKRLLALRAQILTGIRLGSVLFDPTAIGQELHALRIRETQGLV